MRRKEGKRFIFAFPACIYMREIMCAHLETRQKPSGGDAVLQQRHIVKGGDWERAQVNLPAPFLDCQSSRPACSHSIYKEYQDDDGM